MKKGKHEKKNLKKIKEFEKAMLETVKKEKHKFEFDGKKYEITTDGSFVQTLIDGRILYRISLNEDENTDEIALDLAGFTDDFFIAN